MELSPRLIFWEITKRCNLCCPYCRRDYFCDNNLTKEQSFYIVDSITEDYKPLLIFSGGEPLLYPHIFEVSAYAHKKGLKIALATNGTLIDNILAERIESVGFHRVAVSLDGATPEINDSLRGSGTFLKIISSIKNLKSYGISLQINTTVTRRNFENIKKIYNLCLDLGITALHIFAFVPVGCGINVPEEERLSNKEYEEFLNQIADLSEESKIEIKLTCAPHYHRVLFEKYPRHFEAKEYKKGCLAGSGVCFISQEGEVYPCGYLAISAGNIFKKNFKDIWTGSHLFWELRNLELLKGRCKICEYVDFCGGCRARAYAKTGDYLQEEPECLYQPLIKKF